MCHRDWNGLIGGKTVGGRPRLVTLAYGAVPYVYEPPPTTTKRAPVGVAPDTDGATALYHEVSRRLAVTGHLVHLVDYLGRERPLVESTREAAFVRRARLDEREAIDDLHAGIELAIAAPDPASSGPGRAVGVLGFCLGGHLALDLCAIRHDLSTVCFYAFPDGVAALVRVSAPRPIDLAGDITGPILAFWGENDPALPLDVVTRFAGAMHGHSVDDEQHIVAGASHGFLQGLVEVRADSAAATAAWASTTDFFDRTLR